MEFLKQVVTDELVQQPLVRAQDLGLPPTSTIPQRPHSSLGYLTPVEFCAAAAVQNSLETKETTLRSYDEVGGF